MTRPVRVGRRQVADLTGQPPRRPATRRRPPTPPPQAACLCEGTERGLRAAIHVAGDKADELVAAFWRDHTPDPERGRPHVRVDRLPTVANKGDPKW